LVIAGMYFGFSAISGGGFSSIFGGGEKIEIPSVVDMKLEEAQRKYKADGFSIIKQEERASDKEAGTILEQDRPAGDKVAKRDDIVIRVVVSKGNTTKAVGKYTEMKIEEARKLVIEDGFKINIVEKESSSEEKDMVISQEPSEGTEISEGGLVTLYVSKGDGSKEEEDDENNDDNNDEPSNNNQGNSTTTGTQTPESNDTPSNNEGNGNNNNDTGNEGTEEPPVEPDDTPAPPPTPSTPTISD
ncbi:MAG: PASTA domain-containing protein, partial [Clostridia bacterium]|nr:PASTA domain-containing protein [Clostridia bacterium]